MRYHRPSMWERVVERKFAKSASYEGSGVTMAEAAKNVCEVMRKVRKFAAFSPLGEAHKANILSGVPIPEEQFDIELKVGR